MNISLSNANNEFSLELLKQFVSTDSQVNVQNYFVSPFNLAQVLTILLIACRGNTRNQLSNLLNYRSLSFNDIASADILYTRMSKLNKNLLATASQNGLTLELGNGLYPNAQFRLSSEFLRRSRQYFDASVKNLDYLNDAPGSERKINSDIAELTHDKIQGLIPSGTLNPLTKLVVTSAIYFNANWAQKFDANLTQNQPFTSDDGSSADIPMMQGNIRCSYAKIYLTPHGTGQGRCCKSIQTSQTIEVLKLDYVSKPTLSSISNMKRGLSMYFVLPERGKLVNLVNEIDAASLSEISQKQIFEDVVRVTIPKFTITFERELSTILQNMGLVDIFGTQADLSGLTNSSTGTVQEGLHLTNVFHKAYINVNEQGSEAAAATGAVIGVTSVLENSKFIANRPFLYFIADNEDFRILFIGTYTRPIQN